MNTLRKLALCTIMALALLVVPTIFAQETFGLSDEDYSLFTAANAASASATSLTYDFTASFAFAEVVDSDASATLTGSGVINTDAANPQFQLDVTGELVSSGETTPAELHIRLIGDTIYFSTGESGWQGGAVEDIASAFSEGFMQGFAGESGLPVDPEALASGDLSGLAGMEGMSEAMAALASLDPTEFVSMSRLEDQEGLAHFRTALSVSDLLSTDAVSQMIGMAAMSSSGGTGAEIPPEQMAAMGQMMAMMFGDATVTFDQWVDPASSTVSRAVLDVNFPIPDMSGSGSSGGSVLLNFDISLSGYGEAVSVEVPEGATMMPASGG